MQPARVPAGRSRVGVRLEGEPGEERRRPDRDARPDEDLRRRIPDRAARQLDANETPARTYPLTDAHGGGSYWGARPELHARGGERGARAGAPAGRADGRGAA